LFILSVAALTGISMLGDKPVSLPPDFGTYCYAYSDFLEVTGDSFDPEVIKSFAAKEGLSRVIIIEQVGEDVIQRELSVD